MANATLNPVFGSPSAIAESSTHSADVRIVSFGGAVTTIWKDESGADNVVMTATSVAPGAAWSAPAQLSDVGESITSGSHRLVVDADGNMTAAWSVGGAIKTRTWWRGQPNWSPTETLGTDIGVAGLDLAVNAAGAVTAAWGSYHVGNSIRIRTRPSGETTWSDAVDVDANNDQPHIVDLAFNASGDGVAFWSVQPDGLTTEEVRAARFTAASGTWSAPAVVSTDAATDPDPHVAIAPDGTATAIWNTTASQALVATAASGSNTWSAAEQLTSAGKVSLLGEVVSDRAGNIIATFQQGTFDADFVTMYQSSRLVTRTRDAASGTWSDAELLIEGQFSGAGRITVDRDYNIAASFLTAPSIDTSRLGDGVLPASIAVAYRPDGATTFADADVIETAPVNLTANVPVVALDPDGNPAVALFAADAGTARHPEVALGDATAPELRSINVPTTATAGEALTFSVSPFDLWSTIATTRWSFGDGTDASGASVGHTYGAAGSYTVTVSTTDTSGHATSSTHTVTVVPAPVPTTTPKPPVTLPPTIEALLAGKRVTLNAKVSLRRGQRCAGKATATTAFGTTTYRTRVKLAVVDGTCRATGTIKLKKAPSLRTRLRVTISGKQLKARTLSTKRS